jgi:hypothetical protein
MKLDAIGRAIEVHMAAPGADFRITAVRAYEMVGGAVELYERLKRHRRDLIPGFNLIQEVVEYLGGWQGKVLAYDLDSDRIYRGLAPRLRQELGDDARIAAVSLARGAAVWTCNVKDFKKVNDLVFVDAETAVVV